MKVHIHTLRYYPSTKPQCRLIMDLVGELTKHGHEIVIFTAKNGQSCKAFYGEKIVYVNNLGFLSENPIWKLIDYISFNIQSTIKSAYYHKLNKVDIDLYLSGPGFISFVVMIATKLFGFNTVFWLLDRYPDVYFTNKILKGKYLFTLLKKIEVSFENRISHLIFETDFDKIDYQRNKGKTNSTLIRTWITDIKQEVRVPAFWREKNLQDKDVLLYSGNFGYSQNLQNVLEFFKNVSNDNLILVLIGGGSQKNYIYNYIKQNKIKNVFINDFLPEEEYAYVLRHSKYGIISLRDNIEGLSSKMVTYLAHNLPILAFIGRNNEMAKIINEYRCGIIIENNLETIYNIVTTGPQYDIIKSNTRRARRIFDQKMNLEKFIKVLESMANVSIKN